MKNFTIIFSGILFLMISHVAFGAHEIREEMYEYDKILTRRVSCVTFVIAEESTARKLKAICYVSTVPFEFGRAVLSAVAKRKILADLSKCDVSPKSPLTVSGHTCTLGSEKFNEALSLQRAEVVASFLQEHGFMALTVVGKGSQIPFTDTATEIYKNRRVEITQQ